MRHIISKIKSDIRKGDTTMDKRNKYLSWNQYFMGLAVLASMRSKDPNTQVGAAIIDPETNRVVSVGYNGFPFGCSDDEFPWSREGEDTKYAYVVHAELNAILSAKGRDLTGCVLYVTSSPCNECMKAIIQSGIKKIVYKDEYAKGTTSWIATAKMASAAGITMEKYESNHDEINLGFL